MTSNVWLTVLRGAVLGGLLFRASGGRLMLVADCIPGGGPTRLVGGTMRTVIPGLAFIGHCTVIVRPIHLQFQHTEDNGTR